MQHRLTLIIIFLCSLVGVVVAWLFTWPELLGFCPAYGAEGYYKCAFQYSSITEPFIFLFIALAFTSIALLFCREIIFKVWWRFALIYMFLVLVIIFIAPDTAGFLQLDRELVTWWSTGGFVVISLALIFYKNWQLRRRN